MNLNYLTAMKPFFVLAFVCLLGGNLHAQGTEEAAVRATLENYMSAQQDRVRKAFELTAHMQLVDPESGELKKVPITEYIARLAPVVKEEPGKSWKREIQSIDISGNAAQAKIRIDAGTMMIYDYMSLLKINGEWKIVSKVFSRENK